MSCKKKNPKHEVGFSVICYAGRKYITDLKKNKKKKGRSEDKEIPSHVLLPFLKPGKQIHL